MPPTHDMQLENNAIGYVPAGQPKSHELAPTGENKPAEQAKQAAEVVLFTAGLYVPAGHRPEQVGEESPETLP